MHPKVASIEGDMSEVAGAIKADIQPLPHLPEHREAVPRETGLFLGFETRGVASTERFSPHLARPANVPLFSGVPRVFEIILTSATSQKRQQCRISGKRGIERSESP
jgi:hypothetical protein